MSATYDTLTYSGTEKSLADWGFALASCRGRKVSQAADTFKGTLVRSTMAEIDSPTFAFEGGVVVRTNRALAAGVFSGGAVKFVGKRVGGPASASAAGNRTAYEFQGPWYDLANTDYQQLFAGPSGTKYFLPETVLFTSTAVTSGWIQISVGDQIQAVLQWLLDQYAAQGMAAPFQYVGRALNAGAIDLNVGATTGTPGGDYSFLGKLYNYHLPGSGLTIDASLYSLFLPTLIQKPAKCADALTKCLEMSPRIAVWFDYTTTSGGSPLPTIHFDLVDSMASVSLPLFTGPKYDGTVSHKSIDLNPRYDLRARAVVIKYRITSTVSGVEQISYAVDKWSGNGTAYALPGASNVNLDGTGDNADDPNSGLRVVNDLVDLAGVNISGVEGHLDLEQLAAIGGTQAAKRAWWGSKRGGEMSKLEDSRVRFQDKVGAATTIPDAKLYYSTAGVDSTGTPVSANQEFTAADYSFYRYRVVRGTYHAWMKQGSTSILSVKCKAVSAMTFAEYDATSTSGTPDVDATGHCVHKANTEEQHVHLELTNAVPDVGGATGYANFSATASSTPGESYIIGAGGIAQYLYSHLNALQFDGSYVSVAANFVDPSSSQFVTHGLKLCLTGGPTLATTMNAQIQEIDEDYGTHNTSIRFGVSRILSAGDISSLFNMWRFRRTWYNPALRADNTAGGSGTVDLAKAASQANSVLGLGNQVYAAQTDYSSPPSGSTPGTVGGEIRHDSTLVTTITAGKTPVGTAAEMVTMKPREVVICDNTGGVFKVAHHATEGHT